VVVLAVLIYASEQWLCYKDEGMCL